jgi:putative FmdB family regulatory protein
MPVYEFECEQCGSRFEELMGSETQPPPCPQCGAEGARRLLSPVSPPERIVPRGPKVRDSESRRSEREAARSQRIADAQKARKTP